MNRAFVTGRDFAIGVLSVTAVILFTSLILMHGLAPQPAFATGQGGTTGDYVVSTSRLDNTTEVVFIVDTVAQQMNMYGFIPERGVIELVQQFDLRALERLNQNDAAARDGENDRAGNRRAR